MGLLRVTDRLALLACIRNEEKPDTNEPEAISLKLEKELKKESTLFLYVFENAHNKLQEGERQTYRKEIIKITREFNTIPIIRVLS